jgi:hypothetical protein
MPAVEPDRTSRLERGTVVVVDDEANVADLVGMDRTRPPAPSWRRMPTSDVRF